MMEKKQERKGASTPNLGMYRGTTLREENIGKKHVNVSSILKIKHLQRLATWAGGEAGIHPLGALFGNRLAANAEAAGIPLDPSSFLCERCETILQPGSNCTIRIEKNKNKARRRKKSRIPSQNNVVYTCHFCSHRNLKGGTPKGHVKGLLASRPSLDSESKPSDKLMSSSKKGSDAELELDRDVRCTIPLNPESMSDLKCSSPEKDIAGRETPIKKSPVTPLAKLLNSSEKRRKVTGSIHSKLQISGKSSEATNSGKDNNGSSKRKRKSWSSLKEIAEGNEAANSRSISKLAIPFLCNVT